MARLLLLLALILLTSPAARAQDLEAALKHLDSQVEQAMRQVGTPGLAIAVVQGDRVVYRKGFGVRRLGEPEPVTPRTVFQIGSISKSFTALALARLIDQGRVAWNDRVVDHLPDFRMADPWVTREFRVFDLMAQHTGLPHTSGDMQILSGVDRDQVVRSLREIQPETSFRSAFAYQNAPFLAAAQVVEGKTGQTWEANLEEFLFRPLGMADTTASFAGNRAASDRAGFHQAYPTVRALPWDWPYLDYTDLLGPAGSVNSTVDDMARYVAFWMTGAPGVVSADQRTFLQRPQTVVRTGQYYCQALVRQEEPFGAMVWHNGETSGHKNLMAFLPEEKLGIVVLSNLRGNRLPEWIGFSFFDVYHGRAPRALDPSLEHEAPRTPPASPAPARAAAAYAGVFENPVYGRVIVEGLTLRFAAEPTKRPLEHLDGDTFWLQLPVIDQPASGPVRFAFDPSGRVQSLRLDTFDAGGIGTFIRVR